MKAINKAEYYDEIAENTPLTDEELAQFRPLREAMPPEFVKMVLGHQEEMENKGLMPRKLTRGKQKAPTKQAITIRLSAEVVEAFKATGKGWQSRINEALLKHIHTSM
ncbi:TPA: BrnA antitoxin family protein [Mannheimia haemolytica]|uniref:BrnA antitoxin family protein n=1 Tax=Mannheimia haemolytica TaxID=75985 RepID=UPI0009D6DDAD|nr:BrnA antitoxin family protein [Mannheimia haemolytica]UQX77934.1 BrnA antitoxin family protein [Mannheimia haemolytica]UQX78846.1 BrnA antitoxin family protein [Mannheimia haemolytica]HDL1262061.1 BrnA antitoxin family protein [Mannheimia haemolytica]HDL5111565.1 BrnA antitoxin family protein [Mannheimia haemolytica]HDL5237150.1 BrnA antitoxin family protein [Mannheimia haemolytica]